MGGQGYSKPVEEIKLEKEVLWYIICNSEDGTTFVKWYLTSTDTEKDSSGLSYTKDNVIHICNGRVETYKGSYIYLEAVKNSEELNKQKEN